MCHLGCNLASLKIFSWKFMFCTWRIFITNDVSLRSLSSKVHHTWRTMYILALSRLPDKGFSWKSLLTINVVLLKLHFFCDGWIKLWAISLKRLIYFWLYRGWHWRRILYNSHLWLHTFPYNWCKYGRNCLIIKGSLVPKPYTFYGVSLLTMERVKWNYLAGTTRTCAKRVFVWYQLVKN